MKREQLEILCRRWPGVEWGIKWEDDLVFTVAGKMFCCLCLKGPDQGRLSFKVEPERFLEFTDQPQFRPAPYLARAHWVTVDAPRTLAKRELDALLRTAYELVRSKLPRKTRLGLQD